MTAVEMFIARGEIDVLGIVPLVRWIESTTKESVYLEASGITFVDSSGLTGLLQVQAALHADGRTLRIVNRRPAFDRLLDVAALSGVFD